MNDFFRDGSLDHADALQHALRLVKHHQRSAFVEALLCCLRPLTFVLGISSPAAV